MFYGMENSIGKIVQGVGFADDQTGLGFAKDQKGITRLNTEKFTGFLGNYDLTTVADFGGAEDPLFAFAQDVFA